MAKFVIVAGYHVEDGAEWLLKEEIEYKEVVEADTYADALALVPQSVIAKYDFTYVNPLSLEEEATEILREVVLIYLNTKLSGTDMVKALANHMSKAYNLLEGK